MNPDRFSRMLLVVELSRSVNYLVDYDTEQSGYSSIPVQNITTNLLITSIYLNGSGVGQ